jgi:hypothetical protein
MDDDIVEDKPAGRVEKNGTFGRRGWMNLVHFAQQLVSFAGWPKMQAEED